MRRVVMLKERFRDIVRIMKISTNVLRIRLAAISLTLSGIFFVLYPAIRPFSDESSLQGAVAFASFSWVLAHSLAMVAFVLLALGLLVLYIRLQKTTVENRAIQALVLSWIGIGLTLPYYGAETFGLHAIGQEAIKEKNRPYFPHKFGPFGRGGCVLHTRTPLSCSRDYPVCDCHLGIK